MRTWSSPLLFALTALQYLSSGEICVDSTCITVSTESVGQDAAVDQHGASDDKSKGGVGGESVCENTALCKVPVPDNVMAVLHEQWNDLDGEYDAKLADLVHQNGFMEFAHARSTFSNHLKGTFGILHGWNQPQDVCRVGLFHTVWRAPVGAFTVSCV